MLIRARSPSRRLDEELAPLPGVDTSEYRLPEDREVQTLTLALTLTLPLPLPLPVPGELDGARRCEVAHEATDLKRRLEVVEGEERW